MRHIVLTALSVLLMLVGSLMSGADRVMSGDSPRTLSAELKGLALPFRLAVPLLASDSSADSQAAPSVRVVWHAPAVYQYGWPSSFTVDVCNDGAGATLITTGTFGPFGTGTGIYPLASASCLTLGYGDSGPVIDARFIEDGEVCISNSSLLSNAAGSDSLSETRCVAVVGIPGLDVGEVSRRHGRWDGFFFQKWPSWGIAAL